MIFGYMTTLIEFFAQATESLDHANLAGEHITGLGGHPPLNLEEMHETFNHDIKDLLNETLEHEKAIKCITNFSKLLIINPYT